MVTEFCITSFYKFVPLSLARLTELRDSFLKLGAQLEMRGLILLAEEGTNATVCGSAEAIRRFKENLRSLAELVGIEFKDSSSEFQPFRRFKVEFRKELITSGTPDIKPYDSPGNYLSPEEWQEMLNKSEEIVLLDTRNTYESALGHFKGAVTPEIKSFSDFQRFVAESGIAKDKKILMYCTGGIRCEKAALLMERAGYSDVYQLEGGILNYLAHYPRSKYKGECYVFDHRVAVDQDLKPSQKYKLCPHCGDPAEVLISCGNCEKRAQICVKCNEKAEKQACSKNCAYHLRRTNLHPLQLRSDTLKHI